MFRTMAVAGALGLGLLEPAASAQGSELMLTNATGYPIRELYAAPARSLDWGSDRLGRKTLENGQSWTLTRPTQCVQDLRIVFDDEGSEVLWEQLDLCGIGKITLTYSRRTGVTSARTE